MRACVVCVCVCVCVYLARARVINQSVHVLLCSCARVFDYISFCFAFYLNLFFFVVVSQGESLLNDGVACVLFIALLEPVVKLTHLEGTEVARIFFTMTFGGIAWGLFTGFVATTLINLAYDRPIVEITITICVAYLTFIIGEQIKVSGVLAIVTMGLLFSSYGHFAITPSVMHDMHHMWELLAFIGNSLLFGFSGIIIAYVQPFLTRTVTRTLNPNP